MAYHRYGETHRKISPAFIWLSGRMSWQEYGQRHRIEGPALKYRSGAEEYYVRGQELNKFRRILLWLRNQC